MTDILHLLHAIQQRRLVTVLCQQVSRPRAWFYRALRGRTSVLDELPKIRELLETERNPIAVLRDSVGASQADLAELLGITRQTISTWEKRPTTERLERCRVALRSFVPITEVKRP